MTFATWNEARDYAEKRVCEMQLPHGIEFSKFDKRWVVRMLPKPENRYGCDAQCEALEPRDYPRKDS